MMAAFFPRIGKEEMKLFHGFFRQEMAHGVGSFDAQDPHIVDLIRLAAGFLDAMEQTLGAEEVFFRHLFGQGKKKSAVAAAKIDMQGRNAAVDFGEIERREIRLRDQSDHGERIASGAK